MKFYLDTAGSEASGIATLTLGSHPGGDIIATVPYRTDLEKKRALMLAHVPELFEEVEGFSHLWWYQGPAKCGRCGALIEGASPTQIKRLEAVKEAMMPAVADVPDAPDDLPTAPMVKENA